jgi:SAM-dependent methyltransferase
MTNNSWDKIYKREVIDGFVSKKTGEYLYYDVLKPHEDLKRVVAVLKKEKTARVLDLGCGAGRNLVPLARMGFDMHGLDIANEGLRQTRVVLKQEGLCAGLKMGDIFKKLPYQDDFFGAIISVQVLNHNTEGRILDAIHEIVRVIRPGGIAFVSLPGIYAKGKMRYYYNHDSKYIAPRTKVPMKGEEKGLPHFYYNKKIIMKHFKGFKMLEFWRDERDYYCFIARKR